MKLTEAMSSEINALKKPVIIAYDLGKLLFFLYQAGNYKGQRLRLRKNTPARRDYFSVVKELSAYGVLRKGKSVSSPSAFEIFSSSSPAPSPGEVACCLDPFAYVSHLSAMEYHGLTDQFPKMLFLSSPKSSVWSPLAKKQMEKDLGEAFENYLETELPLLKRLKMKIKSFVLIIQKIALHMKCNQNL